ncbi:MAG: patatin-like phospholipase family protein [Lewinellaceae bacterium]|nr:patatin-like phospholipase family protein [Phaeodactylibacter sp.]MCB0612648.1 patatin-like phospholipase family protein [Phaeodactylibacter sp.]MCB9350823.1 patatin-like phospholipase family protein [Lewinellaceae bacterium]
MLNKQKKTQEEEQAKVFRIGIAMAGAVSAGAYTAGVIDYLLESLSRWEKKKENNKSIEEKIKLETDPEKVKELEKQYDHSIPMHDVIIDVIGGSSAGGMTAAITTLSLFEGIRPINEHDNPNKENNKLYDSWVNLNDDLEAGIPTLHQMLGTEDIDEGQSVMSFLNSRPIDELAQKAMDLKRIQTTLPDYISNDLEIILTITSLRGIPLAVNFYEEQKNSFGEPPKPAHKMSLHKGVAHFRLQREGDSADPEGPLPFDPNIEFHRQSLLDAAIATGAFPLGLAPRHIRNISKSYLEGMVKRMFAGKNSREGAYKDKAPSANLLHIELEDKPFNFYAVDGGTVNNEPFGEVIKALEDKCKDSNEKNYAVLMIDPFPNFEKEAEQDINKDPSILDLAPMIIGAIRGQAMIKESDLVEGLTNDHTLRMIFPSRRFINEHGEKEKDPYPISCGALDGFGGFFSRDFREHDFLLGRKNCQSFLRNYFCIPVSRAQKMSAFEDWKTEDERHKRFFSPDVNGYPIIPDMTYYPETYKKEEASEFEIYTLSNPEKHTIDPEQIIALKDRIHHRLKTVLLNLTKKSEAAPKEAAPVKMDPAAEEYNRQMAEVDALMDKHFKQSTFQAFVSQLAINIGKQLWKKPIADKAAAYLTQTVIRTILADFKTRGLLSGKKKK